MKSFFGKLLPGRARKTVKSAGEKKNEDVLPEGLDKRYSAPLQTQVAPDPRQSLVSIVIPCYNSEKYLSRAVQSVLAQTYTNLEVIVVDDGSTDSSVSIARDIAKTDSRVKVTALLRNFGCYYARNVGVMHASGKYIGICDSDDILSPYRLTVQVEALEKSEGAVACLGRIRRWTEDFTQPLNALRFGENSLLWNRAILRDIGWYDSARFGADSEFRERIVARYGRQSIIRIDDELYYLRTTEGSLTLSATSAAYSMTTGSLEKELSPVRARYESNFRAWHSDLAEGESVEFPQFHRSFALGSADQNASPSLGQRCIGAMASYPKRRESLRLTLRALLPQFDEIILYLNDYEAVPDFCVHPNLTVILGNESFGDLRDNGKFYDLPSDDSSYVFTLDDDIIYPSDYVRRMVHYIELLDRKAVVGVHSVIFPVDKFSRLDQRAVRCFWDEHSGNFTDLLGTGTTAWHSSAIKPRLSDFLTKGVCDLWFARLARSLEVPLFNIPRGREWMQDIAGDEVSLFAEAQQRPEAYFATWDNHVAKCFLGQPLRERALETLKNTYSEPAVDAALASAWFAGEKRSSTNRNATQTLMRSSRRAFRMPWSAADHDRSGRTSAKGFDARTYKLGMIVFVVLYLVIMVVVGVVVFV